MTSEQGSEYWWTHIMTSVHVPPYFHESRFTRVKEPDSVYLHLHMCPIIPKRIWAYGNVLLFLRGLDFTSSIKVKSDLLWDIRPLSTEAAIFIPRIRYLFGVSAGSCELWHLSVKIIDAILYPLSNTSLLLDSGQKSIKWFSFKKNKCHCLLFRVTIIVYVSVY